MWQCTKPASRQAHNHQCGQWLWAGLWSLPAMYCRSASFGVFDDSQLILHSFMQRIFCRTCVAQAMCHLHLASLKNTASKRRFAGRAVVHVGNYTFPSNWAFRHVSCCPHYTFEIGVYVGVLLMARAASMAWFPLAFAVRSQTHSVLLLPVVPWHLFESFAWTAHLPRFATFPCQRVVLSPGKPNQYLA